MCSAKSKTDEDSAVRGVVPSAVFIGALSPARILLGTGIAVAGAILVGGLDGELDREFAEGELITWVSVLLLVLISVLNFRLYRMRRGPLGLKLSNPAIVWAFIGAGFAYLALDDAFRIHENLDKYGHVLFGIEETPLTDRADDLLIGFYGLIGLGVLWFYRHELLRFRQLLPYLAVGFGLLFLQVGLDVMTNGKEYLRLFDRDTFNRAEIHDMFEIAEETVKLFAEAVFLSGFLLIHNRLAGKG